MNFVLHLTIKCGNIKESAGGLAPATGLKNKEDLIMAYVIGEGCLECGACAAQCPVGAISEGEGTYVIDADACIECGACAAQCPVEVITEE